MIWKRLWKPVAIIALAVLGVINMVTNLNSNYSNMKVEDKHKIAKLKTELKSNQSSYLWTPFLEFI